MKSTKPQGVLSIATLGDVHLDHVRVPSRFIIERLNQDILTDEYLARLDVIVINGDLFERRVMFDSESAQFIYYWIVRFLRRCAYHGVCLHILEGTPSHDHKQARWFSSVIDTLSIDVEFYYHEELEITPIKKGCDLMALWVPDEINTTAAITQGHVVRLLAQHRLETVDFSFIHGMFVYQEPVASPSSHVEEFYESITSQRIVINHIHTPSSNGKIRAPGSPVRLRHNEEETKGHLYMEYSPDKTTKDWFIETENNAVFTTIDVCGMDIVQVKALLDEYNLMEGLRYIRLKLWRTDHVLSSIPDLKKTYPLLHLTVKVLDVDDPVSTNTDSIIERPVFVSIRADTLPELILTRLEDKPTEVRDAAASLLAEVIE